jgi:hypothetical protein
MKINFPSVSPFNLFNLPNLPILEINLPSLLSILPTIQFESSLTFTKLFLYSLSAFVRLPNDPWDISRIKRHIASPFAKPAIVVHGFNPVLKEGAFDPVLYNKACSNSIEGKCGYGANAILTRQM